MSCSPAELKKKGEDFLSKWVAFSDQPDFDRFVEFAVAASSITEFLSAKGLSGLHPSAHALEQKVLFLFDDWGPQGMTLLVQQELGAQVAEFCERVGAFLDGNTSALIERRTHQESELLFQVRANQKTWFVSQTPLAWKELTGQLGYFGIQAQACGIDALLLDPVAAILLVDAKGLEPTEFFAAVRSLRGRFSAGRVVGLNLAADFDTLNGALGAGCDLCFHLSTPAPTVMGAIVKLYSNEEEPAYRVLVVEDSKTASALIRRTLSEGGIECRAIARPQDVLTSLAEFNPDLVLMDMHMPGCTGVEVTRVIRQHAEFLSTPVVYLSADTTVALQVDALRLGGDHFLTKPFNPVVLNAVVKSKIERYRALRNTMFLDSLTGLLNHNTSKQRVALATNAAALHGKSLCVAMLDIDHFKKVNDSYGHPMGDHVIRSMAWLLKQRLRKTDEVGRYGGEEFLVVLPGTSAVQAQQLLDAIRVDFSLIRHIDQEFSFACTFSAGIACWSEGVSAEDLVKQADEALYLAKRAGRNLVALNPN
jgi:diguanylate cyclase (GGDEF)-like protein